MPHQLVLKIPLLKDKFCLKSNIVQASQREISRTDTFRFLLKTLLKELFSNQGEILSCKSVKPCKNQKTHGRITLEQEINLVQIPHPSKATFKFPPPWARCTVKCQGLPREGMLKLRFDQYIIPVLIDGSV